MAGTPWERMERVLAGERLDRPAAAAWRHFIEHEWTAAGLAEATIAFQKRWNWDICKLNPRSSYYCEAWGAEYDRNDYGGGVSPRQTRPVTSLSGIQAQSPLQAPWAEHVQAVRMVRARLGPAVPLVQTVFSPLSVLDRLGGGHPSSDVRERSPALRFIQSDPAATHRALGAITRTLAAYAAECLRAGADGIFFAITGCARQTYMTEAEYREFGRPYDLEVLDAVCAARLNVLHNCGKGVYWDLVADYPVHAISWAAGEGGNPTLAEAARRSDRVLVGGIEHTELLPRGTPQMVAAAVAAAVAATDGRRLVVAPGCSYHHGVPESNLEALVRPL